MPTISIIIPIYNVEPYIRQCIQSVMDQTLTDGLECILVDDCGQDKSMVIAQQMIDEYKGNIQFRIIHHEKNRGLSAARNTGIKEAKGDWLYFLDSDDWIIPECIELMVEKVENFPDVELVQGNSFSDEKKMNAWLHNCINNTEIIEYSNDRVSVQHYLQSTSHMPMVQNRLIRKTWLLNNKQFFKVGVIHEDEHWTLKAGRCLKTIAICKFDTYYYRINNEGITSIYDKKHFDSICMICDDLFKSLKYRNRHDEIIYICKLLTSASIRYKKDALLSTKRCNYLFFRQAYKLYINKWFDHEHGRLEILGCKMLFILTVLSAKLL